MIPCKEESITDLAKTFLKMPNADKMLFKILRKMLIDDGPQDFDCTARVLKVNGIEWVCLMFKEK